MTTASRRFVSSRRRNSGEASVEKAEVVADNRRAVCNEAGPGVVVPVPAVPSVVRDCLPGVGGERGRAFAALARCGCGEPFAEPERGKLRLECGVDVVAAVVVVGDDEPDDRVLVGRIAKV